MSEGISTIPAKASTEMAGNAGAKAIGAGKSTARRVNRVAQRSSLAATAYVRESNRERLPANNSRPGRRRRIPLAILTARIRAKTDPVLASFSTVFVALMILPYVRKRLSVPEKSDQEGSRLETDSAAEVGLRGKAAGSI